MTMLSFYHAIILSWYHVVMWLYGRPKIKEQLLLSFPNRLRCYVFSVLPLFLASSPLTPMPNADLFVWLFISKSIFFVVILHLSVMFRFTWKHCLGDVVAPDKELQTDRAQAETQFLMNRKCHFFVLNLANWFKGHFVNILGESLLRRLAARENVTS